MFSKENKNIKNVVSGIRPTGNLHLGNYWGVLNNWVYLQNKYKCFFFVADIHALTTNYKNIKSIKFFTYEIVLEMLSIGLDPNICNIFIQSRVPEQIELYVILSMITPLSWLKRIPSYKDLNKKTDIQLFNYGFLGYPLLQASDILTYKADYVPVGKDQIVHIEFAREIVKRFNYIYKKKSNFFFNEPDVILSKKSKILGLDGRKMSKSYNNVINITDNFKILSYKIKKMKTDDGRVYKSDFGCPYNCSIWYLHDIYSKKDVKESIFSGCKSAQIGCVECKNILLKNILIIHNPIIEKKKELYEKKKFVYEVLENGILKARSFAKKTLLSVKEALGLF